MWDIDHEIESYRAKKREIFWYFLVIQSMQSLKIRIYSLLRKKAKPNLFICKYVAQTTLVLDGSKVCGAKGELTYNCLCVTQTDKSISIIDNI